MIELPKLGVHLDLYVVICVVFLVSLSLAPSVSKHFTLQGSLNGTNTTDGGTSYTVDKPCSDVEVEVSGWSEGGEGERNKTKEVYTGVHVNLIHVNSF